MARPILSEYGPDRKNTSAGRATCGGVTLKDQRDVMNYQAPVIPGWDPKGSIGPGIGGAVRKAGSQGPQLTPDNDGGAVGIKRSGGEGRGMGTNRKG